MESDARHLNITLLGLGKMGKLVHKLAIEKGHSIVREEQGEVFIDFSHKDMIVNHVQKALFYKKPIIVGTTGWEDKEAQIKTMVDAQDGTLLYSPNFSLGIYFFSQIVKRAADLYQLFDYDKFGVEIHHKNKADAPSGTSQHLGRFFSPPLDFTSIRSGHFCGQHSIVFDSICDTISLTHTAHSREGFAKGAILAAEWVMGKKGWLTLDDMFCDHSTCHSL